MVIDDFPQRRKPIHLPTNYSLNSSIIIFVTVCTKSRKKILVTEEKHALIRSCWIKSDRWVVGRYMMLPDHIHFFVAPTSYGMDSLKKWVQYWKSLVSKEWPDPNEYPIWQDSFWDRQLRRRESYYEKWEYVVNNPVRHGLVQKAEDWPYQGTINEFFWSGD